MLVLAGARGRRRRAIVLLYIVGQFLHTLNTPISSLYPGKQELLSELKDASQPSKTTQRGYDTGAGGSAVGEGLKLGGPRGQADRLWGAT